MQLHLVDLWRYSRNRAQVLEQLHVEVADADVSHKSGLHELFHPSPSVVDADTLIHLHLWLWRRRIMNPFWRVTRFERHKLERDRKVDQIQVQVLQSKVREVFLTGCSDVFPSVVRVPELGSDPKVCPGAHTSLDGSLDTLSNLFLVAVIASAVDVAVACPNGILDDLRRLAPFNLPCAQPDHWHEVASSCQLQRGTNLDCTAICCRRLWGPRGCHMACNEGHTSCRALGLQGHQRLVPMRFLF
mmetsp:Transcript_50334/g.81606  ORF Transcript_50334/g.81606 Transcript_50334/m.81606 type:complete len:244 (-) Transcript_50334:14-745(-)